MKRKTRTAKFSAWGRPASHDSLILIITVEKRGEAGYFRDIHYDKAVFAPGRLNELAVMNLTMYEYLFVHSLSLLLFSLYTYRYSM